MSDDEIRELIIKIIQGLGKGEVLPFSITMHPKRSCQLRDGGWGGIDFDPCRRRALIKDGYLGDVFGFETAIRWDKEVPKNRIMVEFKCEDGTQELGV